MEQVGDDGSLEADEACVEAPRLAHAEHDRDELSGESSPPSLDGEGDHRRAVATDLLRRACVQVRVAQSEDGEGPDLAELLGEALRNAERRGVCSDRGAGHPCKRLVVRANQLTLVDETDAGRDDAEPDGSGGLARSPVLDDSGHEAAMLLAAIEVGGSDEFRMLRWPRLPRRTR